MYRALLLLATFSLALLGLLLLQEKPDPVRAQQEPLLLEVESMSRNLQIKKMPARGGAAPTTRSWYLLLRRARQEGWRGELKGGVSSVRTWQEQNVLYQAFLAGWGAPAFNPDGPSRHMSRNIRQAGQWSQAVDVSRPEQLVVLARKKLGVGLHQPYADEPWHIEAKGPFALQNPVEVKSGAFIKDPAALNPALLLLCLPGALLLALYRRRALLLTPVLALALGAFFWQDPAGGALLLLAVAGSLPLLFCVNCKFALP